jgi:hypothetical protein
VNEQPGRLLDEEGIENAAAFRRRTLGVHAGRHRHSDGEDQGEEKEGQGASDHGVLSKCPDRMTCMEASPYYKNSSTGPRRGGGGAVSLAGAGSP